MKIIMIFLLFINLAIAAETPPKKSLKEQINQGADNIDRETRKVIKKGKEVWNDKMEKAPEKPTK